MAFSTGKRAAAPESEFAVGGISEASFGPSAVRSGTQVALVLAASGTVSANFPRDVLSESATLSRNRTEIETAKFSSSLIAKTFQKAVDASDDRVLVLKKRSR